MALYINDLCPFRYRCPHGKECMLRGFEVFRCPLYREFEERDDEEMEKMMKEMERILGEASHLPC